MPLDLAVHARDCARLTGGECNCDPLRTTDYRTALEAHEGDSRRLEIVNVTPPPAQARAPRLYQPIGSQAQRHRPISD